MSSLSASSIGCLAILKTTNQQCNCKIKPEYFPFCGKHRFEKFDDVYDFSIDNQMLKTEYYKLSFIYKMRFLSYFIKHTKKLIDEALNQNISSYYEYQLKQANELVDELSKQKSYKSILDTKEPAQVINNYYSYTYQHQQNNIILSNPNNRNNIKKHQENETFNRYQQNKDLRDQKRTSLITFIREKAMNV